MMINKYNLLKRLGPLIVLSKNNAIIAALSYFLTITVANYLGPEQFGVYSHALITASIASIFINFGTEQTAAVLYSHSRDSHEVFNNIFFTRIVLAIPICAILMIFYLDDLTLLVFIYCLVLSSFNLAFLYEIRRRYEKYSYIYLLERIAYIGLTFLLIYLAWLKLYYLFALILFSNAASLLYQLIDNKSIVLLDQERPFSNVLNTLNENYPLVVIAISSYAYGGFSRLILERHLGSGMFGVYSAGWQLVAVGTIFQGQVSRLWRSPIADAVGALDSKELYNVFQSYVLITTIPMVFACFLFVFFPDMIIALLFTDHYADLASVVPILGIYLVVINIAGLVDMLWVALRRTAIYMWTNLIFSVMLLGFLWLYSPRMGMFEFAATTVTFHFLTTVVLAIIWLRIFRLHPIRSQG